MSDTSITEVALRSAVNQYIRSESTENSINTIKDLARRKASDLVMATADSEHRQSELDQQGAAIDLALKQKFFML